MNVLFVHMVIGLLLYLLFLLFTPMFHIKNFFVVRFLKLRTDHKRVRRDGTRYVTSLIVDAPRRFAPSRDRKETSLRRKECQLITGAHDSGKSRWLMRLKDS